MTETVAEVLKNFPRMSEEEATDLVTLRKAMQDEKLTTYSWLLALAEAKPDHLTHSGFDGKTNAEAVLAALMYSKKKLDKMLADHIRKYPD
jgi:hypothetical protein